MKESNERKFKVYVHIFPNKKRYVGITGKKISYRWQNGEGYKTQYVYRAIKKYGWEEIEHKILFEDLTEEEAEEKEIYLISKWKTNNSEYGYNVDKGGKYCGYRIEETKEKISKSKKGIKPSKEIIEKRRLALKGRIVTQETREKLRKSNLEKQGRPVICIETNEIYYSCLEASRQTGINNGNITSCCQGKRKMAGNLHWRYLDEVKDA